MLATARLYGIVDLGYVQPDRLVSITRSLIAGGIDILQLRAKGFATADIIDHDNRIVRAKTSENVEDDRCLARCVTPISEPS